jgi:superfamily II DNA or RNA helicase
MGRERKGMTIQIRPWTTALRLWQDNAFRSIARHAESDFLAVATPGAGKTRLALRVAHDCLEKRKAERVVVVCPTNHLREQWAEAAHREGVKLAPDVSNRQGQEAIDYHGITVSYQQVCAEPELYRKRSARRRTVVIFDEIHHAGDGKEWGDALRHAFDPAAQRLLLSGTPFRTDSHPIPYVRYAQNRSVADFTYGYPEALRDGVCRPVLFPSYEGDLSWLSKGHVVVATFRDGLNHDRRRERLKTALLQDQWLGEVIRDANAQLSKLRTGGHENAGGLIIAMTQPHAREVAALVKRVSGESAMVAVSEDPDASRTIKAFGKGRSRWLVAVNMVREGVDIPRLRVGVYATNVLTEMYFRQVVGRFVRMARTGGEDRYAYLYIPRDPVLVMQARKVKEERDHALEERAQGDRVAPDMPRRDPEDLYAPLGGVARADEWIGHEEEAPPDPPEIHAQEADEKPLFAQKLERRALHKRLVADVAARAGVEHRAVNLELKEQTGSSIEHATMAQLEKRIRLLQRWVEVGYKGRR